MDRPSAQREFAAGAPIAKIARAHRMLAISVRVSSLHPFRIGPSSLADCELGVDLVDGERQRYRRGGVGGISQTVRGTGDKGLPVEELIPEALRLVRISMERWDQLTALIDSAMKAMEKQADLGLG